MVEESPAASTSISAPAAAAAAAAAAAVATSAPDSPAQSVPSNAPNATQNYGSTFAAPSPQQHLQQQTQVSPSVATPTVANSFATQMAAQSHMMQQQTRQAQLQQQQNLHELNAKLQQFWTEQMTEAQQATDFKNHLLPLARIKKIMKSDEDVRMISAEAPVLFAKACEMFILELTHRAWAQTEEAKRRTLQRSDISAAIQKTDIFDFLIDIVPRDDPRKEEVRPVAGGAVDQSQMQYYTVANMPPGGYAMAPQVPGSTDGSGAMMYPANTQQIYGSAGYGPGVAYQPGMVNAQYMQMPQQVMYAPPGYSAQFLGGGGAQDQQPPQS